MFNAASESRQLAEASAAPQHGGVSKRRKQHIPRRHCAMFDGFSFELTAQ
jgi:hypothetical protein